MTSHLQKLQPELNIDQDDVLCVALAGLVHDIGHGPFSHMFEEFVERVDAKDPNSPLPRWEHERMSGEILELLVKRNKIDVAAYMSSTTTTGEQQIAFVIQLIKGLHDHEPWPANVGREEDKRFLFDIVSCSRNGIDVDKLDYLARDAMAAFGSGKPLDIDRIITSSRVIRRTKPEEPTKPEEVRDPWVSEVCYQMKVCY